jgi:hypothetical protein
LKKKAKKETAPRRGVSSRRKARRGGPFHMAAAPLSGRLFQATPNKKKCQALSQKKSAATKKNRTRRARRHNPLTHRQRTAADKRECGTRTRYGVLGALRGKSSPKGVAFGLV